MQLGPVQAYSSQMGKDLNFEKSKQKWEKLKYQAQLYSTNSLIYILNKFISF